MADTPVAPAVAPHGSHRLPAVDVDSYNVELKDDEGFIGDRASKGAFRNMIDHIRKTLRKSGDHPLGEEDSDELSKAELDSFLQGEPEAAGLIHAAIEDFSQEFALIIQRFLKLKEWKNTERIVIGGGFRASRIGELVTGRTTIILETPRRPAVRHSLPAPDCLHRPQYPCPLKRVRFSFLWRSACFRDDVQSYGPSLVCRSLGRLRPSEDCAETSPRVPRLIMCCLQVANAYRRPVPNLPSLMLSTANSG
jgi:hypothetical protein